MSKENKENLAETKKSNDIEMTKDMIELTPATDIYEEKDSIVIVSDMPGVNQNSVDVSYEDDVVSLTGWQEVDETIKKYETIRKGFKKGVYKRSFSLLTDIDIEKISAKIRDGVLTVILPKSEKIKPKKIEVKVG